MEKEIIEVIELFKKLKEKDKDTYIFIRDILKQYNENINKKAGTI